MPLKPTPLSKDITPSIKIGSIFLLILGFLPLLCICIIPFLLYRKLNQIVVKKLYKNTVGLVHPMGQMFAPDFFKPNPRYNIIFCAYLDGNIPFDKFSQLFESTVLRKKKDVESNNCSEKLQEYKYPQLHYTCVKRGGYFYWERKPLEELKTSDYAKHYKIPANKSICTDQDLKKILAGFIAQGWNWEEGQSPFEIHLINNYVGEPYAGKLKSAVVIRTHHFVLDGCSLFNIILSLLQGNLEPHVRPLEPLKVGKEKWKMAKFLKQFIPLLLKMPRDFYEMLVDPSEDLNGWRMESKDCEKNTKYYTNWTRGIDIKLLKRIKNAFGVSFQSVVASVVAKAIQNLMLYSGNKIPKEVKAVIPIPLPGHPDELENYFGFVTAFLPVGENNSEKRLRMAHKQLNYAIQSLNPWITYYTFMVGGHLPHFISKLIMDSDMGNTVDFSTFPGIRGPSFMGGHEVLEAFNLVGTGPKYIGATLTALTCFGKIKFAININSSVWPSEECLERFDDFVRMEVDALLKQTLLIENSKPHTNKTVIPVSKKMYSHKA